MHSKISSGYETVSVTGYIHLKHMWPGRNRLSHILIALLHSKCCYAELSLGVGLIHKCVKYSLFAKCNHIQGSLEDGFAPSG